MTFMSQWVCDFHVVIENYQAEGSYVVTRYLCVVTEFGQSFSRDCVTTEYFMSQQSLVKTK